MAALQPEIFAAVDADFAVARISGCIHTNVYIIIIGVRFDFADADDQFIALQFLGRNGDIHPFLGSRPKRIAGRVNFVFSVDLNNHLFGKTVFPGTFFHRFALVGKLHVNTYGSSADIIFPFRRQLGKIKLFFHPIARACHRKNFHFFIFYGVFPVIIVKHRRLIIPGNICFPCSGGIQYDRRC